jgi:hypothetical protein
MQSKILEYFHYLPNFHHHSKEKIKNAQLNAGTSAPGKQLHPDFRSPNNYLS